MQYLGGAITLESHHVVVESSKSSAACVHSSGKKNLAFLVAGLVLFSSLAAFAISGGHDSNPVLKARVLYTTHDAIYIASDADWATSGFPGDGTEGNPYMISGYDITGTGGDAINIQWTTVHFVIEGCYLHGDGNGIRLYNAENATLTDNNCSGNVYDGISISSSANLTVNISRNVVLNNGWYGIEAYSWPGDTALIMTGCNVSGNPSGGIYAEGGNNLNLTISTTNVSFNGGYGIEMWSDTWDMNALLDNCNVSDNGNNGMYIEASNRLNLSLVSANVTRNYGYGIEAYSDSGNLVAHIDECNLSDNDWTGIYLSAQAALNLTMNDTLSCGNSLGGGWSAGMELYASGGDLEATLARCNLSYNGDDGIYANAYNHLNLTAIDTAIENNYQVWGYFSSGIEAYTSNGNVNLTMKGCKISGQGDQGIYMEAGNAIYLSMESTDIVRNIDGYYGGQGVYGYTWFGDIVAAMDDCNISENYGDGVYLEAWNNLDLDLKSCLITWNQEYGIQGSTYGGSVAASFEACNISDNYYTGLHLGSNAGLSFSLIGSEVSRNGQLGGSGYGVEADASLAANALIDDCGIEGNYQDGVYLRFSEFSSITDSTISGNGGSGMNLNSYSEGVISNNTCESNVGTGIVIGFAGDTIVSHNIVANNGGDGIYAEWSSGNDISWNLLSENLGYGLALYSCADNLIWNNTFLFNRGSTSDWDAGTIQGYDDWAGVNSWNTEGTPHGWGNFWSDWTTPDDDADGIVDYSYEVDGSAYAQDLFPLAQPRYGFAKHVLGIVFDSEGRHISGVDVIVEMIDGETVVASRTAQTDANGTYEVVFDWLEWNVGYSIEVTAEYNSNQVYNSTSSDASPVQDVDAHFAFAISQFGTLIGFLVAAAFIGVLGIFMLGRSQVRRHRSPEISVNATEHTNGEER